MEQINKGRGGTGRRVEKRTVFGKSEEVIS